MKYKPHIKRRNGRWIVILLGVDIYAHTALQDAFYSANHVWRLQ